MVTDSQHGQTFKFVLLGCTPPPSSSRKALLAPAGNQGPMPPLVLSVQSVSSELQEGGNHALIAHVLLAEVVLGRQGCDLS